jgi:twitching motility protein PilT
VVTQQLLPKASGSGRVCATEVLISTPAAKNLIREGKTHQLYTVMQTGGQHGMQTMNSCLADLVKRSHITRELAVKRSSVPDELERLLLTGAA